MEKKSSVQKIDYDELKDNAGVGAEMFANNIELVKNVKVKLMVRLGDAELTVDELFNLKNGSVVKLNQNAARPVDVLLEDRLVARGELVAVDDNFGVSITEIQHY